jgi:hypothetical protein
VLNSGTRLAFAVIEPFEGCQQMQKGPTMLRVETKQLDGALICRLEGRFTGAGAEQVRMLVTRCDSKLKLVVELTEVLFIDAIGEEVLSFLKRLGGCFVADTSYSRDVCERLDLPLVRNHKSSTQLSYGPDGNGYSSASDTRARPTTSNEQSNEPELLD